MNNRHRYALAHPLTDPRTDSTEPFTTLVTEPDGKLIMSVLAVDR